MWEFFKKFFLRFLALIGALTVVFWLCAFFVFQFFDDKIHKPATVSDHTILEWNLNTLPLEVTEDPFQEISPHRQLTLLETIEALDQASRDSRVKALIVQPRFADQGIVGFATVQELREAIIRFRENGKKVVAYTDTFGEGFSENQAYYLATACDEIYVQPSGGIGLSGLAWEEPFLKEALEEWGLEFEAYKRHEYKTALNFLTEEKFTEAHKESMQAVLKSLLNQMVQGVVEGRGLQSQTVRELIDGGPYLTSEGFDKRLIDGMKYRDEVLASLRQEVSDKSKLLYLRKYFQHSEPKQKPQKVVALVYGVGPVVRGSRDPSPFAFEDTVMAADDTAKALRQAFNDDSIDAILFRVNSPGGSYVASDTIWRETQKISQSDKPFIVSMGDMAGSGGYFVAMAADKIVAQPGTLTGSIGVFMGRLKTRQFWEKYHVFWDSLREGRNADMFSSVQEMTPEQKNKVNQDLDRVYADFINKAALGRSMTPDQMHQLAKGRLWTGADAYERGLVDALGGYDKALELIRQELQIDQDDLMAIKMYPPQKSWLEQMFLSDPDSSEDEGELPFELKTPETISSFMKVKSQVLDRQILTMPLWW